MLTYPWALQSGALGPLAGHLAPLAGAELARRSVPHVAVMPRRALVQAAAAARDALLAALTVSSDLRLALKVNGVTGQNTTGTRSVRIQTSTGIVVEFPAAEGAELKLANPRRLFVSPCC